MKRCRTCNRTYTDPNLSYCIEDGTPLVTDVADDESTVVNTSSSNDRSTHDDWNAVAYRPPSAYVPPGTKQRRAWPWVVGVMGAFVLGAVALMIAAAIFVPRMIRSRQAPPPANQPVVTFSPDEPDRSDEDRAENVAAAAPTDETQVLAQLRDLENDWTVANFNADKKKLNRILADDYVGQAKGGGLEGKKDYLNTIERNDTVERWEFNDLKVDLSGNRATLTGVITLFARGEQVSFNFTDKFVWRDGRWQATGSEVNKKE